MDNASGHLDLIRATRAVLRAATAEDVDVLHREVCRLRNALVEQARGQELGGVSDHHARQGALRILHFIDELLTTTHVGSEACACFVRSTELRSMLLRELRLEARTTQR